MEPVGRLGLQRMKSSAFVLEGAGRATLRIYLNYDDCPNADDRETAERLIREIVLNDVVTKGSFILEGYSAARRIAQALTVARADECRRGFNTPFRMRKTVPAKGASAVVSKWPNLRPLYHWTTIEGVHFQSYKGGWAMRGVLISDDARIVLTPVGEGWNVSLDGVELIGSTGRRHLSSVEAAVRAALKARHE